jgi:hypothetical protein
LHNLFLDKQRHQKKHMEKIKIDLVPILAANASDSAAACFSLLLASLLLLSRCFTASLLQHALVQASCPAAADCWS